MKIPDIAYDGILSEGANLQDSEHKICIKDNGVFNFVFMDAANDFQVSQTRLSLICVTHINII